MEPLISGGTVQRSVAIRNPAFPSRLSTASQSNVSAKRGKNLEIQVPNIIVSGRRIEIEADAFYIIYNTFIKVVY